MVRVKLCYDSKTRSNVGLMTCVLFLHSVVFWFGDLNFRIDDYDIHVVKSAIENNKLYVLWEKDQVRPL